MTLETCRNCGRKIGQLEEAYVYRDNPVCAECHSHLTASSRGAPSIQAKHSDAPGRWPLLIVGAVVAIVAVAGTIVAIKNVGRRDAFRVAEQPPSLAVADPPTSTTINQSSPVAGAARQPNASIQEQPQLPQTNTVPIVRQETTPRPPPPPRYVEGNLLKEMARMKAEIDASFPTIPPGKLVGKKFIIARNSAYEDRPNEPFLSIGDFEDHPIYKDVAQKTCTLVRLNPKNDGEPAIIQMDGTNKRYSLMVSSDPYLPQELILASEIDAARARWKGKSLWYRGDTLLLEQKSSTGERQSIKVSQFSKMNVADVKASDSSWSPVEFVLRTPGGEQGFVDCTLSGTTVPSVLRDKFSFYKIFLETDPRALCPYSAEIWAQIESKTVSIGMNREQVLLSWGEPRDIKTTVTADGRREEWIYGDDRFVYVTNGAVSGIQD